jgi:hypothetical protein
MGNGNFENGSSGLDETTFTDEPDHRWLDHFNKLVILQRRNLHLQIATNFNQLYHVERE